MNRSRPDFIDITGQKFGKLTVIKRLPNRKATTYWLCQCECGNFSEVRGSQLRNGSVKSCGCLRKETFANKAENLIGRKFGILTVIEKSYRKGRHQYWKCQCDCGNIVDARQDALKSGRTSHCGCLTKKILSISHSKRSNYSMSKTRIYKIWVLMRKRCKNQNDPHYMDYGGRGITVCDEWDKSFENFKEWALANGYKDNLTIDRINNDKGYFPNNCRWATMKTQSINRRTNRILIFNGKELTATQWADELNIDSNTILSRIDVYGWSVEKALSTPVNAKYRRKTNN